MALTPCKECGNQISKTATACPSCGAKISHTSLFTKFVAGFLVLAAGLVIVSTLAPKKQIDSPLPTRTTFQLVERPNLETQWQYDTSQEGMGRGTIRTARLESTNRINFGFPYQGAQQATLTLRTHPKYGKDVILNIEHGQFLCHIDSCSVTVRFDNGKAETYIASEPEDRSTTVLFIRNYDRFLAGLRKSHTVSIEASFYQEGHQVFEFNTEGLNWQAPVVMNPSGAKIIFDRGVNTETKNEILAIVRREIAPESLNDPSYVMRFSSEDGNYVTYEVSYKGKIKHTSKGNTLSPQQFEQEIKTEW